MTDPAHLHWGADALWRQLAPLLPGVGVEVVARTDSTNTRLIERARAASGDPEAPVSRPGQLGAHPPEDRSPHGRRAGDVEPCLLVAEHQTRGRGRMGRVWQANPVASLTFSLALPLAPADWSGLSLAVGLALAEALDDAQPPRIGLKWPNDLWLIDGPGRGRKLGGILIETVSVGQGRMCIVGVGLNVLPQAFEGLSAACLQELLPDIGAPAALARVAVPLVRALQRFEREGYAPLVARYARRDILRGQAVATTADEASAGVADGVDASGALRVRGADGALHRIVSGEVSVRLAAAADTVGTPDAPPAADPPAPPAPGGPA